MMKLIRCPHCKELRPLSDFVEDGEQLNECKRCRTILSFEQEFKEWQRQSKLSNKKKKEMGIEIPNLEQKLAEYGKLIDEAAINGDIDLYLQLRDKYSKIQYQIEFNEKSVRKTEALMRNETYYCEPSKNKR